MTDIFEAATALALRDASIASVTDHAEENQPGWGETAKNWIRTYSATHREFISEECVAAAYAAKAVPKPHDERAWGGAFRSCSHDRAIVRVGFQPSNNRHRSPTPLWRSRHPNFAEAASSGFPELVRA